MDGERGLFIYCLPVSSPAAGGPVQDATMAFYVSVKELLGQLTFSASFAVDQVSLVADQGILVNGPEPSKTVTRKSTTG